MKPSSPFFPAGAFGLPLPLLPLLIGGSSLLLGVVVVPAAAQAQQASPQRATPKAKLIGGATAMNLEEEPFAIREYMGRTNTRLHWVNRSDDGGGYYVTIRLDSPAQAAAEQPGTVVLARHAATAFRQEMRRKGVKVLAVVTRSSDGMILAVD